MKMQQWTVGILLFDQVYLTGITGPSEVFHHAGYSRRDLHKILFGWDTPPNHPFLVKTVSQTGVALKASNGLRLAPNYSFEQTPAFDIVVMPCANLGVIAQVLTQEEIIQWIARSCSQSQLMTSVLREPFCSPRQVSSMGSFGLLNVGLLFTGAGSAALLQASIPAITTFLSVLVLKERVSRLQLLGIGLSVVGLLLVMGSGRQQGGPAPLLSNLLVVGSVLAWAVYTVQGKHLSQAFPWLVATTASIGVGVICLAPLALGEVWRQGLPHLHADGLVQLLYLGGVSSALGYGSWNYGLRVMDANQAAPYFNLIPVVGLLLSVLLHEPLTVIQVGGGVFTLLGVSLSSKEPSGGRS